MKWEIFSKSNDHCNESRDFLYIDKPISWKGQKCCNWPTLPESVILSNLSREVKINDNQKCC
jgi:hypothetical protein